MKTLLILSALVLVACQSSTPLPLVGPTGPQGPTGTNGHSCSTSSVAISSVLPNGGALISCTDGSSSLIYNGTNGAPGTVITPIKFCSGVPSYPSKFIEYGFCIGGSMYGVYSANDGFLAYLPPGTYSSNGINSSCTFTIGANCAVSY